MSLRTGLAGKVVVVTGAGAGIGRATAVAFAKEKCRVAALGHFGDSAAAVIEELEAAGGPGDVPSVDVAEAGSVEAGVEAVVERWGRVDVLVNNAGILRDAQLVKWKDGAVAATMTDEAWDAVLGVNLKGVFHCTRAVVPHMIRGGGGVILNASSVVGPLRQLRPDELRGHQGGRHRHDAHLGARARASTRSA